jgi:cell division protein FtsW (lipid II flippase)
MAPKLPLLLLLIAITCLSQFYRVSNGVIAPELTRDLGLSARQLGWAGSAFFFAVLFAFQVPVGLWRPALGLVLGASVYLRSRDSSSAF